MTEMDSFMCKEMYSYMLNSPMMRKFVNKIEKQKRKIQKLKAQNELLKEIVLKKAKPCFHEPKEAIVLDDDLLKVPIKKESDSQNIVYQIIESNESVSDLTEEVEEVEEEEEV